MVRCFKADLHTHTCLSPCSDLEMSPQGIVQAAVARGLDIIGISDHNSAANAQAVIRAAREAPLLVIPGMEITTAEEVHVLALFPSVETALQVQRTMYAGLGTSDSEGYIQEQVLANEDDEVEGFCSHLLVGASLLSLQRIVRLVKGEGGLAIAAHVDRQAFGIIGVLGFIPLQLEFDALEVSRHVPLPVAAQTFPMYSHHAFITSSDAHYLKDVGAVCTGLLLEEPTVEEVWAAFQGRAGRRIAPEGCG
ncbi:PHP domain-containing protein [Candidatus Fermentibacteria bacterium]|nr:PHP domain-containing protein [Candidatus Fermentibacteria bacterium]